MKAMIIDDEAHSAEILEMLISEETPEVEILSTETDATLALKAIKEQKPELLFLDIEMPEMNGFEVLSAIEDNNLKVIFTTAYDEFAIKALRVGAIDYLLKPIDKTELKAAINRLNEVSAEEIDATSGEIRSILNSIYNKELLQSKIPISTLEGVEFLPVEKIIRCQSSSNYTEIITGEKKILLSKTLKEVEKQLSPYHCFCRVHHSHLVNLNYVTKYIKGSGGVLELSNGEKINVARNKKQDVMERLKIH